MKYVALLRGINVGGNSIIKMSELKEAYEKAGMNNVKTYINSGNVIFESDEKNPSKLAKNLEIAVSQTFKIDSRTVVVSLPQLKKIKDDVPPEWKRGADLRCYVAFVVDPTTPDDVMDVMKEIKIREGIDSVKKGPGVVYMSTRLSGITKTRFTKLAGTKVYKFITIRNYTTAQKLLELML